MGFATYTPNYTGVALLYVELLQELANGSNDISLRDLYLRVLLDNPLSTSTINPAVDRFNHYHNRHTRPPVGMLVSHSADTLYVGLTGAAGTTALQDMVYNYVEGAFDPPFIDPQNNPVNRPNVRSWAGDYWDEVVRMHPVENMHIRLTGHSLGGVIATYMASIATAIPTVQSIHLCTFGTPKAWNENRDFSNSVICARWINPEDNVPNLPPAPAQALDMWALLSRAQQGRVVAWRHPCRGALVTSTGALSLVGDQASIPLSVNTILQALNSPVGVTGTGHGLATYNAYLRAAQGGVTPLPATAPLAPQVAEPATAALPPNSNVPPVLPELPSNAEATARRVAFAANASAREAIEPEIPGYAKMIAYRAEGGFWMISLMGRDIAIAPTKKKARACARHFNKFLIPFIGVGACDSPSFVAALADWLNAAADVTGGFVPVLANNGVEADINV